MGFSTDVIKHEVNYFTWKKKIIHVICLFNVSKCALNKTFFGTPEREKSREVIQHQ